jgi:hypothetical protein
MRSIIGSLGRVAEQRDTLYRPAPARRQAAAMHAPPLTPPLQTPPGDPRALANALAENRHG